MHPLNSVESSLVCNDSRAMSTLINVINRNNNSVHNDIACENAATDTNVTESLCKNIANVENVNSHICSKSDNRENWDLLYCILDNMIDDTDDNNKTIDNNISIVSTAQTTPKKRKFGFLSEASVSSKEMTPRKSRMYEVHRKVAKKMYKFKRQLQNKTDTLKQLKEWSYNRGVFECI